MGSGGRMISRQQEVHALGGQCRAAMCGGGGGGGGGGLGGGGMGLSPGVGVGMGVG